MIFTEPHPLLGVISLWNYPFYNFMNHRISGIFAEGGVVRSESWETHRPSSYQHLMAKKRALSYGEPDSERTP